MIDDLIFILFICLFFMLSLSFFDILFRVFNKEVQDGNE